MFVTQLIVPAISGAVGAVVGFAPIIWVISVGTGTAIAWSTLLPTLALAGAAVGGLAGLLRLLASI